MKRMCLAALTGALAISGMALAIDDASAAYRGGGYRGGIGRVGVGRVGVGRVGVGRVGLGYGRAGLGYGRVGLGYGRVGLGYGRAGLGYGRVGVGYGRWGGWRPGLGLAAGAAVGTAAYYGSGGYYGGSGYGAYASAAYDTSDSNAYLLRGSYISESDAIAYCAQTFRSYDSASQTFMSYSGQRVSCPQQ